MIQQNENYILEDINCNFCGSSDTRIVFKQAKELYNGFPDRFDVVQCKKCKLCYTNPRPTQETMGYFYPETAGYYQITEDFSFMEGKFHTFLKEKYGYGFSGKSSFKDKIFFPYFNMRANILAIPYLIPNGKLLDIGCSNGKYLLQMSAWGWDTYGIEPHEKTAEIARSRGAGHIHTGIIDNAPWEDGFFDVIVMNMSLEHCHNPLAVLEKMEKLLCTGGVCIVTVPDISGFEARIYKDKAFTLHVPQHLYHFTPKTLINLTQKTRLQAVRVCHHFNENDLLFPLESSRFKCIAKIFKQKYVKYLVLKPLLILCAKFHLTSRMTVYLKKS